MAAAVRAGGRCDGFEFASALSAASRSVERVRAHTHVRTYAHTLVTAALRAAMLPLSLIRGARNKRVTVELKSGEVYVGALDTVDAWMNMNVRDAVRYRTSNDARCSEQQQQQQHAAGAGNDGGVRAEAVSEVHIRGTVIKSLVLPEEAWRRARDERPPLGYYQRQQQQQQSAAQ